MSDHLTHNCGIALIRLLKPLQYYEQKYGTPLFGFQRLYLLMEKQHNRGQDGAGIGCAKIDMPAGHPYMFRERSIEDNSLDQIFDRQLAKYEKLVHEAVIVPEFSPTVKEHFDFGGEVLMGHLRYGTSGSYMESSCHPYFRRSNWPTKNLMLLGNFNMTNAEELNNKLIERGQHPIFDTDTQTILEEIGFYLDEEHTNLYHTIRDSGESGEGIQRLISDRLDLAEILRRSIQIWDGGYVIAGMIGSGDSFVVRDPNGIRPCYYFRNDEIIAFASERVPLMTVFDLSREMVRELPPGHVAVIKNTGEFREVRIAEERELSSCSFERIYFSRGNDPDIYRERKALGGALVPKILKSIDGDLENTVFSYIPNTSEPAYYGLLETLRHGRRQEVKTAILKAQADGSLNEKLLDDLILRNWPRGEKVTHKDIKLRTFISQEKGRKQLVSHIYDISYGVVKPTDCLVAIDDSIVRGTTLRESILKILVRTRPRKIIIASTAPQIRYPDCYGIDMSELSKFIAFQAAILLIKECGKNELIQETYRACLEELKKPPQDVTNCVGDIYEPFTTEQISAKISELVCPRNSDWDGEVEIIYQSIEALHQSIPNHRGDWYFTGNYPTPGGYVVVNKAFVNYFENRTGRTYDVPYRLSGNE